MKIEKVREMNQTELEHKLDELQSQLFGVKIKVQTKQVENTAQLSAMRRDIARIKTVLKETASKEAQKSATASKA